MHSARRKEINRIADKVRTALDLDAMPLDVEVAIERLGGVIEEDSLFDCEALIRKSGESFVIKVQPHVPNRRRFSLAHELGHFFFTWASFLILTAGPRSMSIEIPRNIDMDSPKKNMRLMSLLAHYSCPKTGFAR